MTVTYLTDAQDEVASLRHFSYPGVHVVLLCFSVVKPQSFRSLRTQWIVELTKARVVLNPTIQHLAAKLQTPPNGNTDIVVGRDRPKENGKHLVAPARNGKLGGSGRVTKRSTTPVGIPGPAFLLVGCACDLRNDIGQLLELSKQGEEPVDPATAERLATELGAEAYVECSALTQKNLKTVFDLAIWCGLRVADAGGPACRLPFHDTYTGNGTTVSTDSSRNSTPHGTTETNRSDRSKLNAPGANAKAVMNTKPDKSLWRKFLCIT
ncbi:Rho GTP-binding protein RhoU [Paragonimus heterotremus]|uniref:Rho GTP-binding protein RhoU n=1 Tax=Paragonimus heterotremus TaxID=100268 RepID=A0A8J4SYE2_9TREM|nr:Rho GTP-binding protein RhoU [Paragonimus heterotremus]